MSLEGLLWLLLYVVIIVAFFALVVWGADKIIARYFSPEWAKGARLVVGVILLLMVLLLAIQALQGNLPLPQLRLKN